MKYRSRLILAFATIALLGSLVLGMVIYHTSTGYEESSRKNNLLISARSACVQMDECLDQMNAIMYYVLSDATILDSITMLGRTPEGNLPSIYVQSAQSAIQVGLTTEYIMKNSYRTVFFNQGGFLASSAVYSLNKAEAFNQRLNTDFDLEEIPYLEAAEKADGKSVIIGPHQDLWGTYETEFVFSMMKALRGEGMGYLEVENRMSLLDKLGDIDPRADLCLVINDDQLLYRSGGSLSTGLTENEQNLLNTLEDGIVSLEGGTACVMVRSADYPLTVLATMDMTEMNAGNNRIFLTSFLAAMAVFAVMLAIIIFWSHILARPIRKLQAVVDSTNIENLQKLQPMEGTQGGLDEFTELASAYQAMTRRLDTALKNEKRSSMLQLQAQFDTLQTQVNPHFIYNVLNIISSRGVMADDEVICEMCGSLGNMLRYSTNNRQRYARVRDELEYLRNYFYLLQTRYENRLQVSVDIDEAAMDMIIPKMTLQQIVENSVKHGFHDTDVHMEIRLIGKMEKDRWTIQVQDNGCGMSEEKQEEIRLQLQSVKMDYQDMEVPTETEIGGMGLTNTYARCLLLFQDDLIFTLKNREDGPGFEVTIGQLLPEAGSTV